MDIFVKYPNGEVAGPHSASWYQNRLSSGGILPSAFVAGVRPGARPSDDDFVPRDEFALDGEPKAGAALDGRPPAPVVASTAASGLGMGPAYTLAAVAVALVAVGLVTMYTYEAGTSFAGSTIGGDGPVGGDAYNYIIRANWGVGWITAGAVAGLLSVVAALASVRDAVASRAT